MTGVLLIVLTGLLWAVVGRFFSRASTLGLRVIAFSLVVTVCVSLMSWGLVCNWHAVVHGDIPRAGAFVPVMALGGILNWIGMLLVMAAMRRGHQSGSWTVSQSAMILPFLAGIVFWHDKPSVFNITGAFLIITAIVLFGRRSAKQETNTEHKPWFHLALMAFFIIGISQTCCTIPSHWAGWADTGRLRIPLFATAAMVFLVVVCAVRKEWPGRREIIAGSLCSVVGLVGNYTLFKGMDAMAGRNLVAIVYPIAVGVCMTGFSLYTRFWLKEPLGSTGIAALILGVAGVVLLGS